MESKNSEEGTVSSSLRSLAFRISRYFQRNLEDIYFQFCTGNELIFKDLAEILWRYAVTRLISIRLIFLRYYRHYFPRFPFVNGIISGKSTKDISQNQPSIYHVIRLRESFFSRNKHKSNKNEIAWRLSRFMYGKRYTSNDVSVHVRLETNAEIKEEKNALIKDRKIFDEIKAAR